MNFARASRFWLALATLATMVGCHTVEHSPAPHPVLVVPPQSNAPRELAKTTMPRYRIEAPDVLSVDAIRALPKPPYQLRELDKVSVQVRKKDGDKILDTVLPINLEGQIDLGFPFSPVPVVGITPQEATARIQAEANKTYVDPVVYVTLAEFSGVQQIAGEHLVSQDGSISLGGYGGVAVAGLTLMEAKYAIESHLSRYLLNPEVAVDVAGFNSKVYYIITQGGGLGDNVARVPLTGNETVLDAISQINGLQSVSSKRIWVARPTSDCMENIILPVDWCAISGRGAAATNYQLMPGDRVFVAEDKLVAFDNKLAKIISPIERIFGITILGTSTAHQIKFFNDPNAGGGN